MELTTSTFFNNLKKTHRLLLILHILIPDAFVFLVNNINNNIDKYSELHSVAKWLMPLVLLFCIITSSYFFKKKIDESTNWQHNNIYDKLNAYKKACTIRWVIIDIAIALTTVLLLLTSNYYYLGLAFVALVFIILYAPSKEQAINYLHLNSDEQSILENANAIL